MDDFVKKNLFEASSEFRELVENLNEGFLIQDEDGIVRYVNPRFCELMGIPRENILHQRLLDILEGATQARIAEQTEKRKKGEKNNYELPYRRPDGTECTFQISACPLMDEEGRYQGSFGTMSDITQQKRDLLTLRERGHKLGLIFRTLPVVLFSAKANEEQLEFVEGTVREILGYEKECFLEDFGLSNRVIHPEDRQRANREFEQGLRSRRPFEFDHRIVRGDNGKVEWMHNRVVPLYDENGNLVRYDGVAVRITERKEAELALSESEERYRTIVSSMSDLIFVVDEEDRFIDFHCRSFDDLLFPPEGFLEKTMAEVLPPHVFELYESISSHVRKTGETERFEYPLSIHGETRWYLMSVNLHPDGRKIVQSVLNITERKRAEEALRRSEEKFRTLHEMSPIAIVLNRLDNGQFLESNKAFWEMIGYTEDEVRDLTYWDITPRDYADMEARQLELLHTVGRYGPYEKEFVRSDGTRFPVLLSGVRLTSPDGVDFIYSTIQDITERKRAEEALRESERRYEETIASIDDNIWRYEIDEQGDFVDSYNSPVAERLLGLPEGEIGKSFENFFRYILPEDLPAVRETMDYALTAIDKTTSIEYRMKKGDGTIIWCRSKGTTYRRPNGNIVLFGTTSDITERKHAEEALHRSEETARALLNAPNDIALLAKPDGTVLAANQAALRSLRSSPEELIGHNVLKMMGPETGESRRKHVMEVLRTARPVRFEDERAGKIFDNSFYPLFDDSGNVDRIAVYAYDITERRRAEEALRRSEKQYHSTVDSITEGIHVVDPDLRITLMNDFFKNWSAQLGLDIGDPIGKSVFEVFPHLTEDVRQEYLGVFESGEALESLNEHVLNGQKVITETRKIPIIDNGQVIRVVTVLRDITARKLAEERLARSESKYRSLFNLSNDAILLHDQDGHILDFNQRAVEIIGYDRETLLKMNLKSLHPESEWEIIHRVFETLRAMGSARFEIRAIKADGTLMEADVSSSIIDPNLGLIQEIVRDVTERKREQEALHKAKRLAATCHLATSITHEINNPLMAISSALTVIEMENTENSHFHRRIGDIRKEVQRIANLTRQVFDLYAPETGPLRAFSMAQVIKETLRMIRPQANNWGIKLVEKIESGLPRVTLTRGEVKQVLYNIIFNALEASPQGEEVQVECRYDSPWLRVEVLDRGPGISEKDLPHIFEAFFTTKTWGVGPGGMGLGLSISSGLMKEMGGTIEVRPNHPRGTVFSICFPLEGKSHRPNPVTTL